MPNLKYFFYGSNMCIPFLKEMGIKVIHYEKATLKNHCFKVNVIDELETNYGYANIESVDSQNKNPTEVEGLLVIISKETEYLVDEYEGFPELYLKKSVEVITAKKTEQCLAYYGSLSYISNNNLLLNETQKQRISWGARYLSPQYQKEILSKYLAE